MGSSVDLVIPARARRCVTGAGGSAAQPLRLASRCGRRNSTAPGRASTSARSAACAPKNCTRSAGVSSAHAGRSIRPATCGRTGPGRASARSGTPHNGEARRGNSQNAASASGRPIATSRQTAQQSARRRRGAAARRRIPGRPGAAARPAPASRRPGRAAATAVPGRAGRWRTARTGRSRAGCAHRAGSTGSDRLDRQHRREQRAAGVAAEGETRVCASTAPSTSERQQQAQPARASGWRQDTAATSDAAAARSRAPCAPAIAAATAAGRRPRPHSVHSRLARPVDAAVASSASARAVIASPGSSASARRQAWRCVGAAAPGPARLPRQLQAIAPAFAFGLVDPARQPADAVLVGKRGKRAPVEHDVGAERLFVFAHQQGAAARRRLPGDRAARIAAAIAAQVVDVVAGRMQPRLGVVAAALRQRRAVGFGRRIDQQRRLRPDPGPGAREAERLRVVEMRRRPGSSQPRRCGRQIASSRLRRCRWSSDSAAASPSQSTRRPRRSRPGSRARSARAAAAARRPATGSASMAIDAQPAQLQVRGEQAGVGRAAPSSSASSSAGLLL